MRILKFTLFTLIIISFSACGGSSDSSSDNGGWTSSTLTAKVESDTYEVEVRYYLDKENGLTVLSDKNDISDSNGDGLVFAIFETNGKLQFDFVKDGERKGARVTDWTKANGTISGAGELKPESGLGQGTPFEFSLKL